MKGNKILTAAILLVVVCALTGCGQKREAKDMVQHFMECLKDSADKCDSIYPDFKVINAKVNCDTFDIADEVETMGDTLAVRVVVHSKDSLNKECHDSLTFYLCNDVYDKLNIIGSQGLMKFTPYNLLTYYAVCTGANKKDDWDYDFAMSMKSVRLMYKSLEKEISEKVKISYDGSAKLSSNRRSMSSSVTITNKLGFELPAIVVYTHFMNAASTASYMAPKYYADGSQVLKNIPQGGSTYSISAKIKFPRGSGPSDATRNSEGGFSQLSSATIRLLDETVKKFIEEHHFSGHEYEEFIKDMHE